MTLRKDFFNGPAHEEVQVESGIRHLLIFLLINRYPCHDGVHMVWRWCYTTYTETKDELDSVSFGHVFYYRPFCITHQITLPHVTRCPPPPSSKSRLRIPPGFPPEKRPDPPPSRFTARSLYPLP